jgi:hypothetical protein
MASASLIQDATPLYPPIQPLFTDKGQQNRLFIDQVSDICLRTVAHLWMASASLMTLIIT